MKPLDYYDSDPIPYDKKRQDEYRAALRARRDEFFTDVREELGYDSVLNEKGCKIIEDKAWMDGHSMGYRDVFNELCDLSDMITTIVSDGLREPSPQPRRG